MATGLSVDDVLLGIPGEAVAATSPRSPLNSKIGGSPDFYPGLLLEEPPCCSCCKSFMCLYAQLYCSLEGSPYHRTLYCYCCVEESCTSQEKWCVLRSQAIDPGHSRGGDFESGSTSEPKPTEQNAGLLKGTIQWCDGEDDWGDEMEDHIVNTSNSATKHPDSKSTTQGDDCITNTHDCTTKVSNCTTQHHGSVPGDREDTLPGHMDKLTLTSKDKMAVMGPVLPSYFVDVVWSEDTKEQAFNLSPSMAAMVRVFEKNSVVHTEQVSGEAERYEKATTRHGDAVFHKFYKKVSLYPSQGIRYQFGGEPLLIAAHPTNTRDCVPKCEYCGSVRVFEFQLMPSLVYFFEQALSHSNSKMKLPEFGTVLVYTCSRSCWESKNSIVFRKECSIIQHEKDNHLVSPNHIH